MGRLYKMLGPVFALAIFLISPASAQNDAPISDQDCQAILENYAASPKAVAPDVVKACQEIVAMAPAAGAPAAADPCVGADAGNSVYCWGDWAALAPAAAGGGAGSDSIYEHDFTQEELGLEPLLDPSFLVCAPGSQCGFSAFVEGFAPPTSDNATLVRFELPNDDGTSFINDPGGAETGTQITSQPLDPNFSPIGAGLNSMFAVTFSPTGFSLVNARVSCDPCTDGGGGTIIYAADTWQNQDDQGNFTNGVFGWGRAATQANLDSLSAGNATLNFSGLMSLNSAINADLTLTFGNGSGWSGQWSDGGQIDFDAGGAISGASFVSDPGQFSGNVTNANNGALVQGALVGIVGDQAVVHGIDVNLAGVGNVRDVGILREAP